MTTVSAPLLVCCGLVTLDVLQVVERVPAPDEKVVATDLEVGFGGPAANAAATAVALGVRARLVTALGAGPIADLVRSGLRDAGVELVDLLEGAPGTPAVSTVLVTRATGERAVVSVNATGVGDLSARARGLADDALAGASVLLLDGHHLGAAVALAGRARAAGVTVVLDGGSWKPGPWMFKGLVYTGKGLGEIFGDLSQFGDIEDTGGYLQAGYNFTPNWSANAFYGMSKPNTADVIRWMGNGATGLLRNRQSALNVQYSAGAYDLGLEWMHDVLDSTSNGVDRKTTSGNQLSVSALYHF